MFSCVAARGSPGCRSRRSWSAEGKLAASHRDAWLRILDLPLDEVAAFLRADTVAYGAANLLRAIPGNVQLEPYAQVVEASFQATPGGTLRGDFGSSATTTLSMPFIVQSDSTCAIGR